MMPTRSQWAVAIALVLAGLLVMNVLIHFADLLNLI